MSSRSRVHRHFGLLMSLALLAIVPPALADDAAPTPAMPSTAPATTNPSDDTPKGMLLAFDRETGKGPEAFLPYFHSANNEQTQVAKAQCRLEAQMGLLQLLLEKKWGKDGATQVLHAFGNELTDDIESADYPQDDADHARVVWKDGNEPLKLVRVDGKWKVDVSALLNDGQMAATSYVLSTAKLGQIVSGIADDIAAGKFQNAQDATDAVEDRLKEQREKDANTSAT